MSVESPALQPLPDYRMQILEKHLDSFGHVNHANYLSMFEEARWDLVTRNGYGLAEVVKARKGPVVLEAQLKYLKELRLREFILITTRVDTSESKAGVIYHQMVKEDGGIACEARLVFGLFDMERRRLIAPTAEWKRALGMR